MANSVPNFAVNKYICGSKPNTIANPIPDSLVIRDANQNRVQMSERPRIIDLFCGCGGFGLGAELAGFETAAAIDIDATLQSAYRLNFPKANVITGDVSLLDAAFWKKTLSSQRRIDGIIGGPPCQGFSRIGKKEVNDPRNSLVGHFYRQVKLLNPKFFIMENVVGILDKGSREHLFAAMTQVPPNYEVLGPIVLNAADFGVPTRRRRVVVIGIDPSELGKLSVEDVASSLVSGAAKHTTVSDAISDLPTPIPDPLDPTDFGWAALSPTSSRLSDYARSMRQVPMGMGWGPAIQQQAKGNISGLLETKHTQKVVARFAETIPGTVEAISRYPRLSWDGVCPTLRAGTGSERGSYQAMRPIHPSEPRVITVREAARLQGFPDWFVFHPSKWHSFRMIGNSVSPQVSKHLLSVLGRRLSKLIAA